MLYLIKCPCYSFCHFLLFMSFTLMNFMLKSPFFLDYLPKIGPWCTKIPTSWDWCNAGPSAAPQIEFLVTSPGQQQRGLPGSDPRERVPAGETLVKKTRFFLKCAGVGAGAGVGVGVVVVVVVDDSSTKLRIYSRNVDSLKKNTHLMFGKWTFHPPKGYCLLSELQI